MDEVTNAEKAEEICSDYNYTQFLNDGTKDTYTESAVLYMLEEMAKWKDEQVKRQFIDKAVRWLKDNASKFVYKSVFDGQAKINECKLAEEFVKAIAK